MLARPEAGSKEDILLFIGGKPTDEGYNWNHIHDCAAAQYCRERLGDPFKWIRETGSPAWELNSAAQKLPRTFGSLYGRLQKLWG
jgi:hypothetical protein